MSNIQTDIKSNSDAIRARIDLVAQHAGRDPAAIRLMGVSKVQPAERIQAALAIGLRLYGENRVQEAQDRWGPLRPQYPDLELHLIGPLQTNKAKDAVALFDVIQTVDREKLARKLADEMKKQNRHLPCFIQVNTGAEPQKAGILPDDLAAFHAFCRDECGLDIVGLMCIPPADEPPALHFALLKKLAAREGLDELSMGMSDDFDKAVPLGATIVRVGSALFGDRDYG